VGRFDPPPECAVAYFSAVFILVMSLFFLWVVFWPSRGADQPDGEAQDERRPDRPSR